MPFATYMDFHIFRHTDLAPEDRYEVVVPFSNRPIAYAATLTQARDAVRAYLQTQDPIYLVVDEVDRALWELCDEGLAYNDPKVRATQALLHALLCEARGEDPFGVGRPKTPPARG